MKALTLLLLRASTGLYLVIWGIMKLRSPQATIGLSDSYYQGLISSGGANMALGIAEVVIGIMVVLGLFRKYLYPAQAVIYGVGMVAIGQYLLDPFALYIADASKVTWFPSTTLFFSTLVLLAFKGFDNHCLDKKLRK